MNRFKNILFTNNVSDQTLNLRMNRNKICLQFQAFIKNKVVQIGVKQDQDCILNNMNQNQFKVQFSNSQNIQDIGESVVFQNSLFLKMIQELNIKGDVVQLDIKEDEFNNFCAFLVQMKETLKGQEKEILNNLEDIKASEQFKDLFKEMTEKQVLSLLSLAEYLDIPNLIMLLAAQYSSLIKDQPTPIINQNF